LLICFTALNGLAKAALSPNESQDKPSSVSSKPHSQDKATVGSPTPISQEGSPSKINTQEEFTKGSTSDKEKTKVRETNGGSQASGGKQKEKRPLIEDDETQPPGTLYNPCSHGIDERKLTPPTVAPSVSTDASPSKCFICSKSLLPLTVEVFGR
jgi:hypothetical protein